MDKIKISILSREMVSELVKFLALLGAAVLFPFLGRQFLTGPLVNAALFVAVYFLDIKNAILVGLVPSVIALSVGFLSPVLSPMIPFVMIGNTLLVMVFYLFKDKNYWLGVTAASFLKFIFLWSASSLVVNFILKKEIAASVAQMMSWPQLLNALAGGIIAYVFLKAVKKL